MPAIFRCNSGRIMIPPVFTWVSPIFLLFFLIPGIHAFPQVIACESLVFGQDSPVLTEKMKDQLDQLCRKVLKIKRGRIGITVWQHADPPAISGATLAENRMRRIFACLVEQKCIKLVSEIRIKPLKSDSLLRYDSLQQANLIEICILERFPDVYDLENDTIWETVRQVIPVKFIRESDTIIRGANGALVRFHSMSLGTYKLTDFWYEVDEMFNTESIGNHNMSTMTTTGTLIASFKAVRIWVTPLNTEIPSPAELKISATILIPVDSAMDSPESLNRFVFRPGTGSKSFVTWSKSVDSLRVEVYAGKKYFMIQTDAMGNLAIGTLNQTRTPFYIHIPRFRKIKITVKSGSDNTLAIFNDPDQKVIRLKPGEMQSDGLKDFSLTAEAVDNSGNLYILNTTIFDQFANKKKKNCFEIRKKDFQKL